MKNRFSQILILIVVLFYSCKNDQDSSNKIHTLTNSTVLEKEIDTSNDEFYLDTNSTLNINLPDTVIKKGFSTQIDCRKTTKKVSLKTILAELSPQVQSFKIDPTTPTTIHGKKGTIIEFPKGIFQFKNGSSPQTIISIHLKECYSFADIITEGLHTQSYSKILETGGMVNIEAKIGNDTLQLKKGKFYTIQFPKNEPSKNMEIFYATSITDSTSTWVNENPIKKTVDTIEYQFSDLNMEFETGDELPYFLSIQYELSKNLENLKFKQSDETIIQYFQKLKNLPELDTLILMSDSNWSPTFSFMINEEGTIINLKNYTKSIKPFNVKANKIFKSYMSSLPAFNTKDIKMPHSFHIQLTFNYQNLNLDQDAFKEAVKTDNKGVLTDVNKTDLNTYVLTSSKLGWINCDVFWNIEKELKVDYLVKTPYQGDAQVHLIFKNMRSILKGYYLNGYYVFKNVPLNKEVKLIGIHCRENWPLLSTEETKITKSPFYLKVFKSFTLEELDQELSSLN